MNLLQCAVVCYSVLQWVAVRCSALQCAAVSALQCAALCCNVISPLIFRYEYVAVCCSVLQCVAVWYHL